MSDNGGSDFDRINVYNSTENENDKNNNSKFNIYNDLY